MSEQTLWTPAGYERSTSRTSSRGGEAGDALSALSRGRTSVMEDPVVAEMAKNRRVNARVASAMGGRGGAELTLATGRSRDPMFYWRQNNMPFEVQKPEELKRARAYCRVLYQTHPVIASAIDVFAKYPLTGMEVTCLAAETRVVTDQGTRPIADLAGQTHRVITSTGHWVDARFDSYGVQRLLKMTLRQNRREQVVYATPEHRWYVQNSSRDALRGRARLREETTSALQPGDHLEAMYAINRVQNTHPSSVGIAHGLVYGDGSLKGRRNNEGYITLFGDKNIDLLRYFPEPNIRKWQPENSAVEAVTVYDLPGYFKARPSLEESCSYLYGFLAGWFAADGTVSSKGECILYSASRADIDYAQTICHRLGIRTGMPYEVVRSNSKAEGDHTMWYLPLDAGSLTGEFFAMSHHRERWVQRQARGMASRRDNWTVVSVEETDRVEEVFCAKVPGTESFVLEGNLLTGNCKDEALTEFYTTLFFDQLNYEDYLVEVGREYWTVGEAWPLGSFNETLGVWEDDELLNPDDIDVIRSPFLKEPRFQMALPEAIRRVITERSPKWEFESLMRAYPELKAFQGADARMPVSNVLLKQLMFKADTFHPRGIPILMRGFRAVMQEEMLNAAQDAIADRLYTPLILAKLGASATDLGTSQPWIPTDGDIEAFEEALDLALAGDFRVLTHHFAVQMDSVFGREQMPNLDTDFERITDRILQVFGLSKTMLSGASCLTGETMIHVRRAGKGFRMPIKSLVARFNGTDEGMPGRRWDPAIPTHVARAEGSVVRSGLLAAAWASGVKQVFLLTTEGGRTIRASAMHPFLTEDDRWVKMQDLRVGDRLKVNDARDFERKQVPSKPSYKSVGVKYHPHQVSRGSRAGAVRYTVPMHRLVMEAVLNEMPLYQIKAILNNDPIRSKELIYLPAGVQVHHRDHDPSNNALENLQVMTQREHNRHHLEEGGSNYVMWRVGADTIVSIEAQGQEETFDLRLEDDPHNFIANGFVVHNSGETYAADAINRDVISQLLTGYQKKIKALFHDRARVVAEAQEHFDYEERNGKRYPIMEEVLEVDEESGEQRIVEQPKLLVPELRIKAMTMADETDQRQFLEAMRVSGVPISMKTRLVNVPVDLKDEIDAVRQEQVDLAVEAQETRKQTYLALKAKGYPIPEDLRVDFEPKAMGSEDPGEVPIDPATGQPQPGGQVLPTLGMNGPNTEALAPTPAEQMAAGQAPGGNVIPLTRNKMLQQQPGRTRPPESDEMRASMPKPASKAEFLVKHAAQTDDKGKVTEAAKEEWVEVDLASSGSTGLLVNGPRHVGMRRQVVMPRDAEGNLLPMES